MLTARDLRPQVGPNIIQAITAQQRLEYRVRMQNPSHRNDCRSRALQGVAAARFAAANGWRSARQFGLAELGKCGRSDYRPIGWGSLLDHPLWFAAGRRNIAIVSQPYNLCEDEFRRCAQQAGLDAHVPPNRLASFHNPGITQFFVLTQPGVIVQWLPEQEESLQ